VYRAAASPASTNPKPFQGLKLSTRKALLAIASGFNQPKTLSGIETNRLLRPGVGRGDRASTNPKPFQGLKHVNIGDRVRLVGFNQPKTLSGIETRKMMQRAATLSLQPTQNPFRD